MLKAHLYEITFTAQSRKVEEKKRSMSLIPAVLEAVFLKTTEVIQILPWSFFVCGFWLKVIGGR